jgi:SAM-dependent methyltransferase
MENNNPNLQKDIFLHGEADAWFERNHAALEKRVFGLQDPVIAGISEIAATDLYKGKRLRVLEVGCGEGKRLAWLAKNLDADVYGIDPSKKAVEQARSIGVTAERGTADHLPFETDSFDVVIFGFCLYLCDRQDLFRIAQEADRLLKQDAWIVIHDFFSTTPVRRQYHHKPGVYSFKMDYRTLFCWHPAYTCYHHRVLHHGQGEYTDDPQEWVATSVIRKKAKEGE